LLVSPLHTCCQAQRHRRDPCIAPHARARIEIFVFDLLVALIHLELQSVLRFSSTLCLWVGALLTSKPAKPSASRYLVTQGSVLLVEHLLF
jgi:hypothetical protein